METRTWSISSKLSVLIRRGGILIFALLTTDRCHSGELFYVFGTVIRMGLPPRDQYDVPMSQFTLDTWTAFARTYNPNPSLAYLNARGFTNTTIEIEEAGTSWQPVSDTMEGLTLRLMQYPSKQESFEVYGSQSQCDVFGFGLDYYEPNG